MSELEELQLNDDKYSDRSERYDAAKMHFCESCEIPQLLVRYEQWFKTLQGQLDLLRDDMQKVMNRVEVMSYDHRNLPPK